MIDVRITIIDKINIKEPAEKEEFGVYKLNTFIPASTARSTKLRII